MGKHIIKIDSEKCIGCGQCVKVCVAHNIELKSKKALIMTEECVQCSCLEK